MWLKKRLAVFTSKTTTISGWIFLFGNPLDPESHRSVGDWTTHLNKNMFIKYQIESFSPCFMVTNIPTSEWNHPSCARKTQIQRPSTRERSSNFTDPQTAETFRRPFKPSAAAVARVGLSLGFFAGELFEAHDSIFFTRKNRQWTWTSCYLWNGTKITKIHKFDQIWWFSAFLSPIFRASKSCLFFRFSLRSPAYGIPKSKKYVSYHYPSSKPQKNAPLTMRKQALTSHDGLDELVSTLCLNHGVVGFSWIFQVATPVSVLCSFAWKLTHHFF